MELLLRETQMLFNGKLEWMNFSQPFYNYELNLSQMSRLPKPTPANLIPHQKEDDQQKEEDQEEEEETLEEDQEGKEKTSNFGKDSKIKLQGF